MIHESSFIVSDAFFILSSKKPILSLLQEFPDAPQEGSPVSVKLGPSNAIDTSQRFFSVWLGFGHLDKGTVREHYIRRHTSLIGKLFAQAPQGGKQFRCPGTDIVTNE
jgi:hypothetical protein